jgi:hypothetical protein
MAAKAALTILVRWTRFTRGAAKGLVSFGIHSTAASLAVFLALTILPLPCLASFAVILNVKRVLMKPRKAPVTIRLK